MGLKRIFGPARCAHWPRPLSLRVRQLGLGKMSAEQVLEEFRVPSKGTWTAFLICGLLLLVWLGVELMFVNAWVAGEHPISSKERGVVLAWTSAGIPLFIWLLWLVFGRERITLTKRYLRIRREVAGLGLPLPYVGFGLAFNYDVEAITKLRLAEPLKSKDLIAAPRIQFTYRGSIIGFGSGLQIQEALNIISITKQTYHIG